MNSIILQASNRALFLLGAWVIASAASLAAPAPGEEGVQLILDMQGIRGPVRDIAFSPDGKHVAACGGKEVRIWDLETGQLHYTLRGQIDDGPFGDCLALAFSPDNCFLVVGIHNHTEWGSIRIYDTHDFSEIKELLPGHRASVTRLAFSHDSRYLAAANSSGTISIFDWPLRRIVASARPADHVSGEYTVFDFPVDEHFLLVRGKTEEAVIAVPSGTVLENQRHEPSAITAWRASHAQSQSALGAPTRFDLLLSQQAWMAAGLGKEGSGSAFWTACWNAAGAGPPAIYRGHQRRITALAISPRCRLAASGQDDGAVHVWDAATAQPRFVLRSASQPCFRAAFDATDRTIGFAPAPLQAAAWGFNSFGRIDRVFEFHRRSVAGVPENATFPAEFIGQDKSRLTLTFQQQRYGMQLTGAGKRPAAFGLPADVSPTCFTLLRHEQMGIASPIVVGDKNGELVCYDPLTGQPRRRFVGHVGFVASLSESADGRLLTSSSTDGTIRLWSLGQRPAAAWIDFPLAGDVVSAVPATSSAQRAGIRVGDRLVSLDGRNLAAIQSLRRAGGFPYRPGQRVIVGMDRGGAGYQTEVTLVAAADIVEPLLSLALTARHEWILWTPEGYFEASPGAGDLVGFHVNQGPQRAAHFLPVHQFRRQLYRPDIIDQVLQAASVPEAIAAANAVLPEAPPAVDLRQSQAIEAMSPPEVRVLSPLPNATTTEGQIHVLAEVISRDDNPLADVRLLVNGRPNGEKGALVIGAGEARSRISISQVVSLLPGENTISLLASNAHATSVPASVTVSYTAPPEEASRRPDLHLLSIGVSQYANEWLNLRYAHLDARDFAGAWDSQRGRLYGDVATTLLVNQDASAARIRDAMKELLGAVDRRDVAVIFISAHGKLDPHLGYYLATHEVDPKNLAASGLHFREITQLLEQLPCKVLMFVDTCHSAGITGAKSLAADPLYELTSDEYGAIVFASSLSRETSLEDEAWGHGAFTTAILETFGEAVSDLNGDGYLSLTEMEQRVYDRVQNLTEGLQHPVMSRPATVPNLRFYRFGDPRPLAAN